MLKVRETYAEIDSPRLGFVADFSATMHSMSPTLLRKLADGLDDEACSGCRRSGPPTPTSTPGTRSSSATCTRAASTPESLGSFAQLAFNMHGHVDPAEWADIMPQIMHVHAKFYDIDEHGDEPAIDYPELVRVFVEGGYSASCPASGRATRSPSRRGTRRFPCRRMTLSARPVHEVQEIRPSSLRRHRGGRGVLHRTALGPEERLALWATGWLEDGCRRRQARRSGAGGTADEIMYTVNNAGMFADRRHRDLWTVATRT